MDEQQPTRIIVELVSSADVKALEARDDELRKEIADLRRRIEGLHRVLYDTIEALGGRRSKG